MGGGNNVYDDMICVKLERGKENHILVEWNVLFLTITFAVQLIVVVRLQERVKKQGPLDSVSFILCVCPTGDVLTLAVLLHFVCLTVTFTALL